ncbi:MAG TPA: hypothetical protein VG098_03480 [Nitrososphaera sp.]|nr:hypothetical protein [Nitrososphaera sp.]
MLHTDQASSNQRRRYTVARTNDDSQPHAVTSGVNGQPDGRFDSSIMVQLQQQ